MGKNGEKISRESDFIRKEEEGVVYFYNPKTEEYILPNEPITEPSMQVPEYNFGGAQLEPLTREDDVEVSLTIKGRGGPAFDRVMNVFNNSSASELELYRQAFIAQQTEQPRLPYAPLDIDPEPVQPYGQTPPPSYDSWNVLGDQPEFPLADVLPTEATFTPPPADSALSVISDQHRALIENTNGENSKADAERKARKKLVRTRVIAWGAFLTLSGYAALQFNSGEANASQGTQAGFECVEEGQPNPICIGNKLLADLNPLKEHKAEKPAVKDIKDAEEATEPEKE